MEDLMGDVYQMEKCSMVWIAGPPGSGKTTTLYWLYKQCKDKDDCYALPIPAHNLECNLSLVKSEVPQSGLLLVFIDINKPLELSSVNLNSLERLLSGELFLFRHNVKFVIAVSSNFPVYLNTSYAGTTLRSYFNSHPVYRTEAFSSNQAMEYLASILNNEEKASILCVANNIPRLLSLYRTGGPDRFECFKEYVRWSIAAEFDDIYKYITKANSSVLMLQLEAKLLWAVQVRLPYTLFSISPTTVKQLWLSSIYS